MSGCTPQIPFGGLKHNYVVVLDQPADGVALELHTSNPLRGTETQDAMGGTLVGHDVPIAHLKSPSGD